MRETIDRLQAHFCDGKGFEMPQGQVGSRLSGVKASGEHGACQAAVS